MNLTVGIATSGRRELTSELVAALAHQTRRPDQVIVSPAKDEDADPQMGAGLPFPVKIVRGPAGLPAQRNTILRAAADSDIMLFFDDDFVPGPAFLEMCERILEADDSIAILTGTVIADGINTPGISLEDARAAVARDMPPSEAVQKETYGGYGCNMAIRMAPVVANDLLFDEALPLYGWLEDIDFSRRVAPYGGIVRTNQCRGVHMGVKKGRTSGVRFGYSQIANPIYMMRKGSMSQSYMRTMVSRNVLANLGRSLAPEPWVDRTGRLRGNLHAVIDLVRGQLDPRKILTLE